MKVTFLGTGTSQGVPVIACDCRVCQSDDPRDNRLRSSIHVEWDGLSIIVDTGPDFRQQMLRHKIQRVDGLFITHAHRDHIAGLDEVRSFNFKQRESIPLYCQDIAAEKIKGDFSYIFGAQDYPGLPKIDLIPHPDQPIEFKGKTILPIEVMHYRLPVWGFRFDDFTYITDAKTIEERELEKIKGSRFLVLNALQKEEHISHLTLEQAISLSQKIQPEKTILIHISHNLGLHKEVSTELPDGVILGYDGLEIQT